MGQRLGPFEGLLGLGFGDCRPLSVGILHVHFETLSLEEFSGVDLATQPDNAQVR
jgi:hypothetical protein